MEFRRVRIFFISSSMFLIIIVLGFSGGLNITSFQKVYTDSLISSYRVVGAETVRKVEYAIKYGKPLDDFYGMKKYLEETKENSPQIQEVMIVLPDGKIAYRLNESNHEEKLSDEILKQIDFSSMSENEYSYATILFKETYHVFIPIQNSDKKWIGSLDIQFSKSIIDNRTNNYLKHIVFWLGVLVFISGIFLIILQWKISIIDEKGDIRKKLIFTVFLSILGVSQLVYGIISFAMFKSVYIDISKENSLMAAKIIQKDVNLVLEKGVKYNQLNEIESWMKKIIKSVPEIENIYIMASKDSIIYKTSPSAYIGDQSFKSEYIYDLRLNKDTSDYKGTVNVIISKRYIDSKLKGVALDALTVLVTSFLFMVEVSIFIMLIMRRKLNKTKDKALNNNVCDESSIRILSFLFCMANYMAIAFIPVIMKNIYRPIFGISQSVMSGIPVSLEMFFGGIATVIGGFIVDKKGWKPTFLMGIFAIIIGSLFSGIAWEPVLFIIGRALAGFGYGINLISMQGLVISAPTEEERSKGIFAMNSGAYAGLNCGAILGSMVADMLGFSKVFFVIIVMLIGVAIFSIFFIKNNVVSEKRNNKESFSISKFKYFFTSKNVIVFFIFIIIPVAINGMFLNYFLPLFSEGKGLSTSDVGRAFLLHGLCIIYMGPLLSKFINKYFDARKSTVASGVMAAGAVLIFSFFGSTTAAFITVFFMGLAESFGDVSRYNYFTNLKEVNEIGEGKSIAFQHVVGTLGESAGPIIFGITALIGSLKGVGVIASMVMISMFVFMFITSINRNSQYSESDGK